MAEVAVQPLLQELLARIERIEKKIDLLVEELPESEIEELRKEVKEFAEKTHRGDFSGLISADYL